MADIEKMNQRNKDAKLEAMQNLKDQFSTWRSAAESRLENAKQPGLWPAVKDVGYNAQEWLRGIPLGIYERQVYGPDTNRSKARIDAYKAALEAVKAGQSVPKSFKDLTY